MSLYLGRAPDSESVQSLMEFVGEVGQLRALLRELRPAGSYHISEIDVGVWRTGHYTFTKMALDTEFQEFEQSRDQAAAEVNSWTSPPLSRLGHEGHPRALFEFLQSKTDSAQSASHVRPFVDGLLRTCRFDTLTTGEVCAALFEVGNFIGYAQFRRVVAAQLAHEVGQVDYLTLSTMNKSQMWNKLATSTGNYAAIKRHLSRAQPPNRFDRWLERGHDWITGSGIGAERLEPLLRQAFESKAEWADATFPNLPPPPNGDWYREVRGRLVMLRSMRRVAPEWPATFASTLVSASLLLVDERLACWVRIGNMCVLFSIGIDGEEIRIAGKWEQCIVPIGIALSWYIDVTATLVVDNHPHFERSESSGHSHNQHAGREYVIRPTVALRDAVRTYSTRVSSTPLAHDVRGHVRRLPDDHRPSAKAINEAPSYIRRKLQSDETFVRAHSRGENSEQTWAIQFSRHSALGDALGSLGLFGDTL